MATAPFDWSRLATLRLRARAIADGVYAGAHRSARKGSGVEFGGHRPYVPGDDLRFLDRRAMLRHDRLILRELTTETDRAVRLLVDASASMGFRGKHAPIDKLGYAAALAGALARIALASGDPVGLDFLAGENARSLPPLAGREAFERLLATLEAAKAGGDAHDDPEHLDRAFAAMLRGARRGSVVVVFSDVADLPEAAIARIGALAGGGRTLLVVGTIDPAEATLPYDGPVRFVATEGSFTVETDVAAVRAGYLDALAAVSRAWNDRLVGFGGAFLPCTTAEHPVDVLRRVLLAAQRGPR